MARMLIAFFVAALTTGSPSRAQEWAEKIFEKRSHDFGAVARSAKTEYDFVFANPYEDDVHVASVRSSCGCTTPRIEKDTIETYEEGKIIAHINSDRVLGQNGATITVVFDKPQLAEVQLQVRVYVHSDVIVDPSSVAFGVIAQGSKAERKVSIGYAGRDDWRLTGVQSPSPHLFVRVVEVGRESGKAFYELITCLEKTAPPGYIRDHLILVTNDPQPTHIPILVEGQVATPVSVSPVSLFFGVVAPGQTVTKSVVVSGKKPFRITAITSESPCLEAKLPAEKASKSLYVIPVTFTAGREPGSIAKSVRIKTDLDGNIIEFSALAAVAPR
jgi:hypothetical protein